MGKIFKKSDFKDFWDESDYTYRDYIGPAITKKQIAEAEKTLGYKLPQSYVELLENKNGGVPKNTCFPSKKKTSWADDHVAISGLFGINSHEQSLLGGLGDRFLKEEWGYPDIGIVICDCPSAGHDAIMLDYRMCKKEGNEPSVVHVDAECDKPKITPLAENFETFIRGLVHESVYEPSDDEESADVMERVESGSFSPVLTKAFEAVADKMPDAGRRLRNLAAEIVKVKKDFHLHGDDLSCSIYDYLFWLFCHVRTPKSMKDYLEQADKLHPSSYDQPYYALMVALGTDQEKYGFCTNGYSPDFLIDWWNDRLIKDDIIETPDGYMFSDQMESRLFSALSDLENGVVPSGKCTMEPPSLFSYAKSGKDVLFHYELKRGAKLDTAEKDEDGLTMLHYAALWGKNELCQFLLVNDADPNAKSNFGVTPYQCAVKSKDAKTIQLLIDAGTKAE